ncbi:MAG: amidohydrolase family protein [Crocinitomix sp.]|nr:amidohydrolase family protein [Crocinitomix sp.]
MKQIYSLLLVFIIAISSFGQTPSPQTQMYKRILFQNGSAHVGNGEYVHNSVIGIEEGKILFVKNALTYQLDKSEWDTIISLKGKHIYPGFIAANLTLGLTEIDAVRATRDFDETGSINPNVRSLIAFNTDSKVMYTVRTNGVLVTQSTPRGGLISGTSSIMALDGWNWEDAVYKADDGVHLNWPIKFSKSGWWAQPGPNKANEKYNKTRDAIYAFFEEALSYSQSKDPSEKFLKLEAMRGIFNGKQRLFIHADYAPEINDIIDFSRRFDLEFPVIVGGYDAHLVAARLIENKFAVMLGRPHLLPTFEEDLTYINYQSAAKLQKAGVPYCIQAAGDMEVMNARNLPFLAGTAWAYGLTEEEAVASISLNVAKILGIDDRIGSLESGKDATLFISDGNALDMMTNNVTIAMVKGNFIVLDNHQMQLSRKYHERYGIE